MRVRLSLLAILTAPLAAMPADAARLGDPCRPWVSRAFQKYFDEEEKFAAAKDAGASALCPMLARQKEALEIVVQTISVCPSDYEEHKFLPEIEALLGDVASAQAINHCPEPLAVEPQQ